MLAEVNGVKLAYSDSGAGEPTVLLVHGYPLNRSMWDPQLGALREEARARVIAADLRGFGASDGGPPGPLTMDQHADDLSALLDVLGVSEPVVFCGLSMGGYVGFSMWRRHPERVGAFVFADSRATADTPEGREARFVMATEAERLNSSQPVIDAVLPRLFAPGLQPSSLPVHLVRSMIAGSSARAVADGARGLAARPDSTSLLASIAVPTLVIVGELDVLTPPADSELMASLIPGAHHVTIAQAGHMSNLENPSEFNEALLGFVADYSQKTSTL